MCFVLVCIICEFAFSSILTLCMPKAIISVNLFYSTFSMCIVNRGPICYMVLTSLIRLSLSCLISDLRSTVSCKICKVKFQLLDSTYKYTNQIDVADVINLCGNLSKYIEGVFGDVFG